MSLAAGMWLTASSGDEKWPYLMPNLSVCESDYFGFFYNLFVKSSNQNWYHVCYHIQLGSLISDPVGY